MQENLIQSVLEEEKNSKEFGFYWETIDQIFDQIRSECLEIKEAFIQKNKEHCKEEIGDLIHAAISLAYFCGYDPNQALEISFKKYQRRFNLLKKFAKEDGFQNLKNQPLDVLMKYWKKSKEIL